jgi:hypothetical protein
VAAAKYRGNLSTVTYDGGTLVPYSVVLVEKWSMVSKIFDATLRCYRNTACEGFFGRCLSIGVPCSTNDCATDYLRLSQVTRVLMSPSVAWFRLVKNAAASMGDLLERIQYRNDYRDDVDVSLP